MHTTFRGKVKLSEDDKEYAQLILMEWIENGGKLNTKNKSGGPKFKRLSEECYDEERPTKKRKFSHNTDYDMNSDSEAEENDSNNDDADNDEDDDFDE